jgi:hypothetical protein
MNITIAILLYVSKVHRGDRKYVITQNLLYYTIKKPELSKNILNVYAYIWPAPFSVKLTSSALSLGLINRSAVQDGVSRAFHWFLQPNAVVVPHDTPAPFPFTSVLSVIVRCQFDAAQHRLRNYVNSLPGIDFCPCSPNPITSLNDLQQ